MDSLTACVARGVKLLALHSIIIPTADRQESIRRALDALMEDTPAHRNTEIIVVDNSESEENSNDLAEHCDLCDGKVKYVREVSPGLTAARHRGVRESSGALLTFIDDDVEVSKTWLAAIRDGFCDPEVAMIGGPSIPRFSSAVPLVFFDLVSPTPYGGWMCSWLSLLDVGKSHRSIDPRYIWGLNFSIRRTVLMQYRGFHPDLVPERLQRWQGDGETGLTSKVASAGLRCDYLQDALVFHRCTADRLCEEYLVKRAYYQGVCDSFESIRAGHEPRQRSLPAGLARAARKSFAIAHSTFRRLFERDRLSGDEERLIGGKMKRAFVAGWQFHQSEVSSDPRLRDWVRRTTFMDADIRDELSSLPEEHR